MSARVPCSHASGRNIAANALLAQPLEEIAAAHNASPAQVALAWLLTRRPGIVPIPGTQRMAHLEDNARAPALKLTRHDEARLDVLAASVHGERYGSQAQNPTWVSPPLQR